MACNNMWDFESKFYTLDNNLCVCTYLGNPPFNSVYKKILEPLDFAFVDIQHHLFDISIVGIT